MKKTLAILLALALVLCMMPSAAFAGEEPTSITGATVEFGTAIYTGAAQTPVIKSVVLENGSTADVNDFEIQSAATYLNANTYDITIKPTSEAAAKYTDTATGKYTISKLNLSSDLIYGGLTGTFVADDTLESQVKTKVTYSLRQGGDVLASLKTENKIKVGLSANGTNSRLVTFTSNNDDNITGTGSIAISTGISLSGYTLQGVANQSYSGKEIALSGTSLVKEGATTIYQTSGAYTLEYTGDRTHPGQCSVKAVANVGSGYAGETGCQSFSILSLDVNKVGNQITIDSIKSQAETGSEIKPAVVVKETVNGTTRTLVENVDYTVSYQNNVKPGTATVSVTFIKDYVGTRTTTFTIVSSAYDLTKQVTASLVSNSAFRYNGSAQPAAINVTKGSSTYFTIAYRYYDETQKKTIEITSPIDAKTYDVYLVGRSPYVGEIRLGTYTIPKFEFANVDITATQGTYANTPNVVVRALYDNITFVKDKDYTVSSAWVSTSTNKGYVTVTSTGTGNLAAGSKSITYFLVAKNISYCSTEFATGSKSIYQYTGSAIMPKVKVRDSYTVLTEGTDYSITYKDASGKTVTPKEAGTYTIEITGKGAYSGTTRMNFTIVGIDISGYTVTLKESSVKADGYNKVPVIVSVKNGYYATLSSADYTVSYEDAAGKTVYSMSTPGTYKVVVTGKNGYSGSTYATFRIVGTPQEISVDKTSYKKYKDSEPFKITATATGDGTGFSYVSSNPAVATVSATGVVTIHKIGRAKITVTTTGMKKSEPASEEVYVKVYPDKAKITQKPQTEGNKGSFRVRWEKQDDVTYYEVRYARNSAFKSGTYLTKKVNASTLNYTTQSTKISNLKRGARYYVKVRAVKVVYNDYGQELKYYGTWSNWRSVVTKQ